MKFEQELLLVALAIGLYLYDSAVLLEADEGVVLAAAGGRWRVAFGMRFSLRGRELFLPNPFAPFFPLYRLSWESPAGADGGWTASRARFAPLAPLVAGMALALFGLLPLALFLRLGDAFLLASLGLLYACIAAALVLLALRRERFGLTPRRLAALAFESLVCSPFALNLIRKVSIATPVDENLAAAARRLQSPEDWEQSRRELISRIDDERLAEDEDSARDRSLAELRRALAVPEDREAA